MREHFLSKLLQFIGGVFRNIRVLESTAQFGKLVHGIVSTKVNLSLVFTAYPEHLQFRIPVVAINALTETTFGWRLPLSCDLEIYHVEPLH